MKQLFLLAAVHALAASGQTTSVINPELDPELFEPYQRLVLAAHPRSSLAHYNVAEIYFAQRNYQSAANEFREALNGDLQPAWTLVWSHLSLGKIFDLTGQHERASNEYRLAEQTTIEMVTRANAFATAQDTVEPRVIEKAPPEYSDEAKLAKLEGTVLVGGVIGEDGVLRDPSVTRGIGLGLDEEAMDAVQRWVFAAGRYQGRPKAMYATFAVDFLLPSRHSRWHLIRTAFATPAGVSEPAVLSADYPIGDGLLNREAIEEGLVITAIGRPATATVAFEVSEQGIPMNLRARSASEKTWGTEAVALVSKWKFAPGLKGGKPVSIPCVLDLVWGPKDLTASMLVRLLDFEHAAGLAGN